jgi:hypothetical protein
MPDPAAAADEAAIDATIAAVAKKLTARLRLLASLPDDRLDRLAWQARVREIARTPADAA